MTRLTGIWRGAGNRLPIGWLQLTHSKSRLAVALAGVAFANILIFMQLGFMGALFETSVMTHRALKADLVLISTAAVKMDTLRTIPRRRLYQALSAPGVAGVAPVYIGRLDWRNPTTLRRHPMQLIGVDPDRDSFVLPAIRDQLHKLKRPDTLLFDALARGEYAGTVAALERGETLGTEIDGRTLSVTGLFGLGASFGTDGTLVASDQTFFRLLPMRSSETVSIGLVTTEPGADIAAVKQALTDRLPDGDTQAMTLEEFVAFEQDYQARYAPVGFVFSFGAGMGLLVGLVIVFQILSTDVNDHMAEYATFKAMGYRDTYLLGIIIEEALILAGLGFIPGFLASLGLYELTRGATALPIELPPERIVIVFLMTFLMCCASGALATRRLADADPADIF